MYFRSIYGYKALNCPQYKKDWKGKGRSDWRDTVFWKPLIHTDVNGEAFVRFGLSDKITSFRVRVSGVGGGMLGMEEKVLTSKKPFFIVAKIPLEVSAGDAMALPLTLRNELTRDLSLEVNLKLSKAFQLMENPLPKKLVLPAKQARTYFFPVRVLAQKGEGVLEFRAEGEAIHHSFSQRVHIQPRGFPKEISWAGRLDGKSEQSFVFALPKDFRGDRSRGAFTLFPDPVSSMEKGMDSMLREPHGCFEQTSSSNYPNVMIMRYLKHRRSKNTKAMRRAYSFLEKGYRKLVGFETRSKGYEWFGRAPGHEALTAYGVLQFHDMKKIFPKVSQPMIQRTIQWLLARRDGKGGFLRSSRALDRFGRANIDNTNAYITYALAQAGYTKLEKELAALRVKASSSKDPYFLSLVLNALLKVEGKDRSLGTRKLAKKLLSLQGKRGEFRGTTSSITRSGGINLSLETTSLAVLALLQVKDAQKNVFKAVSWLRKHRRASGGFGSTQATVLTLRALMAYEALNASPPSPGVLTVKVNGKPLPSLSYTKTTKVNLSLKQLSSHFRPGKNKVTVKLKSRAGLPFGMGVHYYTYRPTSSKGVAISLKTRLSKNRARMGEVVRLTAVVRNKTSRGLPMTLVRLRFPGALRPQTWQLKALRDKKQFAYFETGPREVVLYFMGLAPKVKKTIHLDLVARVTGNYDGAASVGYLYYTDDKKVWTKPLWISVLP